MTSKPRIEIIRDENLELVDREFRALIARASKGMSPLDLSLATLDWIAHLAISPGKQLQLLQSFVNKLAELGVYAVRSKRNSEAIGPASQIERRMSSETWRKWPFNVLAQAHQSSRDLLNEAVFGVEGVSTGHEAVVHAAAEQILELLSPANLPFTNPDVIASTREERGRNLVRGVKFAIADQVQRMRKQKLAEDTGFQVGENLAITPGKVVFQNELMELIQYSPATEEVGAEPVLISPAWIMKYYILDLQPKNSMFRYLVEQGKTVFAISWKNPQEEDRDIGFEDYVHQGIFAALDAINAICPNRKIHGVGYCIGGTLLSVAAATMARDDDDRLKTITLFAAQTDFTEAGEIARYISHSQLSFLEKVMWKRGYLTSEQMGSSFARLRSSDLVYGSLVDRYLLGKETSVNDLMHWNADGTRMPHRMHHEYLSELYLNNNLAANKFKVDGKTISISDIRVPMYVLGTETDHIAPWISVFKIHQLTPTELTFTLTSGGHNAGVVSGPQHPRRRYRSHTRKPGDKFMDPETWMAAQSVHQGSWWPHWSKWLDDHTSSRIKPPGMGASRKGYKPLSDAPGEYVFG